MNILYYQHQFPAIGGIETVTAALANDLVARGHQVAILSFVRKDNADRMVALDTRVDVVPMPSADISEAANAAFLQRVIDERRIDVLVFQDSYAPIEKALFACRRLPPVVTVEHSSPYWDAADGKTGGLTFKDVLCHLRHPFARLRQRAHEAARRRLLYGKSAAYVLLSNRFFGEFRAVTHLGDTRKLVAIANPRTDKAVAGVARAKKDVVLFCGTLNNLKGCDLLIDAWRKVVSRTDWTLRIVGDGPERARLEASAKGLARVEFVGYEPDPMPFFAEARIFAFPSRREGWGLVLVEAMAHGCVPVAFESYSAVHDIVADGETGLLVPAFDVEAYAGHLLSLMEDRARLDALSRAAERSADRFSIERIGAKWERLFQDVLSRPRHLEEPK